MSREHGKWRSNERTKRAACALRSAQPAVSCLYCTIYSSPPSFWSAKPTSSATPTNDIHTPATTHCRVIRSFLLHHPVNLFMPLYNVRRAVSCCTPLPSPGVVRACLHACILVCTNSSDDYETASDSDSEEIELNDAVSQPHTRSPARSPPPVRFRKKRFRIHRSGDISVEMMRMFVFFFWRCLPGICPALPCPACLPASLLRTHLFLRC